MPSRVPFTSGMRTIMQKEALFFFLSGGKPTHIPGPDRPQAILNRQIVDSGHLLIGIFGNRLGTPTGKAQSGTIEEIEEFRKTGRYVALYFSSAPSQEMLIPISSTLSNNIKSSGSKKPCIPRSTRRTNCGGSLRNTYQRLLLRSTRVFGRERALRGRPRVSSLFLVCRQGTTTRLSG